MPRTPKFTPNQLFSEAVKYKNEFGFIRIYITKDVKYNKYVNLTVQGFSLFLGVNHAFLYQLPTEFENVKKDIDMLFFDHFNRGMSIGDIKTQYGLVYARHKYDMSDAKTIVHTNVEPIQIINDLNYNNEIIHDNNDNIIDVKLE